MLWQKKKKRKKATKPKAVTLVAPQQPVEEIPQTTEPEKKEETPKQKKPVGKKSKKVLTPEKAFLEAFGRLTNRLTGNDNKENYWFTPMYFSNVWVLRRIFGGH